MLQVCRLYVFVELRRIIMLYGVGYLVIIDLVLPLCYNTLRGRQLFEKNIGNKVKEGESTLKLMDVFNDQGMMIIISFKYIILLSLNTQKKMFKKIKRFYIGGEDINNIGYMIKRSDDIVYARGVKTVQMSEMVMFEIEGEKLYGIVKCLDNESVVGIAAGGDTIIIATQKVSNKFYTRCKRVFKNKIILKRNYHCSNVIYGKDKKIVEIANCVIKTIEALDLSQLRQTLSVPYVTKKNVKSYKVKKTVKDDANNEDSINYNESFSKIVENHRGLVSCQYDVNNITTIQGSTCTTKPTHVNIIKNISNNNKEEVFYIKTPTVEMIEPVQLSGGFELVRTSIVTRQNQMKIQEDDIQVLEKDVVEYINYSKGEIMKKSFGGNGEIIEFEDGAYFLNSKYIIKEGNIKLYMDFSKAVKITNPLKLAKFSLDVVDDPKTEKFVNIPSDVKVEIKKQYQDLLKSLPQIYKD